MEALILAGLLLGAVWWWSRKRRRPGLRRSVGATLSRPMVGGGESVPPRLMGELHRLTHDRRVSERLIERIAFNYPNRSRRWCVEKAIYDLRRDRRS